MLLESPSSYIYLYYNHSFLELLCCQHKKEMVFVGCGAGSLSRDHTDYLHTITAVWHAQHSVRCFFSSLPHLSSGVWDNMQASFVEGKWLQASEDMQAKEPYMFTYMLQYIKLVELKSSRMGACWTKTTKLIYEMRQNESLREHPLRKRTAWSLSFLSIYTHII